MDRKHKKHTDKVRYRLAFHSGSPTKSQMTLAKVKKKHEDCPLKPKVFLWISSNCTKLNEGESFDMLMLQSLQLKYFSMHLIKMTCSSANLSITLKKEKVVLLKWFGVRIDMMRV